MKVLRIGAPLLAALVLGTAWIHSAGADTPVWRTQQDVARAWDEPGPDPDRIVLTWADDPATTQSVSWRTNTSVTVTRAEIALATPHPGFGHATTTVDAETHTVDAAQVEGESVAANFHSATFTDLIPDTVYAYRVGDGRRWSEWFQFRTASAEPEPFSFIYFGDAQNDVMSLWSRVVRASVLEAPDARFMLHAGDLVNRAHRNTEWGEWFHAGGFLHAMIPSIPTPGNHEYDAYNEEEDAQDIDRLSQFWNAQFELPGNGPLGVDPETAYYIDYQGVRIISLNSNRDHEPQARWLEAVLSSNPHPWTVVTHHHPIFSSGSDRDNSGLRELLKPIYDRYGVDLVLQGHDHTYARGRGLDESTGENTRTGVNLRDDEAGTVYVVSVSGAKMYEFKPDRWDGYDAQLDRNAENTQLFQVIHVDGDRLSYEAFTPTGQVYDAFDLVKRGGDQPNEFVDRANDRETFTFETTDPYGR